MKRNTILRISILPLILITIFAFTNLQPKREGKSDKSQEQSADKGKGQEDKGNKDQSHGNKNNGNESHGNWKVKGNDNGNDESHGKKGNDHGNKYDDHGKSNKMGDMENAGHAKMKKYGNGNSKIMNGKRDMNLDWGLNDFANRKHPKDQKKVTICHNPTNNKNGGVTINVSENALKAHMNHGDQLGDCNINYSDRWSSNYVKSRENVYNTYEQTWENMSYSEALLRLAADKLFGIKSNLDRNRSTLSAQEIQRREALIYELQNNTNALDNQLNLTNKRLDSNVNIIIKL